MGLMEEHPLVERADYAGLEYKRVNQEIYRDSALFIRIVPKKTTFKQLRSTTRWTASHSLAGTTAIKSL
jgi:hypothetical protein